MVRPLSPTFHFAFPGWFLTVRHVKRVWYCSSPVSCSSALLSLTLSQFVLPFLTYRLPNSLGLLESLVYHTLCLHTPFNTIPHLLHLPGLFPSQCLELALFSTPFSMFFSICISYHRFGTTLTSPSLPGRVSWSLSALKSLPTSSNTPGKWKTCLFSRDRLFIILHFWLLVLSQLGSVIGVLEEDRKT